MVARVEFLNQWRDGRFRWSAAIVLVVLVFAVVSGWSQQLETARERATAQQVMREQWIEQGEKNPHSAAHFGIYAFRLPTALASFDRGIEPYVGSATWLEAHYQNEAAYAPARDETVLRRFGELSASAMLQLAIPLLLIGVGSGLFASEREAGVLRLVAGTGVPAARVALGKAVGVTAALAVPLVPAAILGAVALIGAGGLGGPDGFARVAGSAAAYLAYFGVFLVIAVAVSARARSARAALMMLLAFWVGNALVVPRAARSIAERVHPTPSWHAFNASVERDKREGIDGHNPVGERAAALERQVLTQYGVASIDELPVDFNGIAFRADEDNGNRVYDRHYGALWDGYARQHRVHTLAGLLAPSIAVRDISMGMAASDWWHHRHFAGAAEDYRRRIVRMLNEEITYNSRGRAYEENQADRSLWERTPDFTYETPSASWALAHQRGSFAVLATWLMLGLVAAGLSVRRYRLEGE